MATTNLNNVDTNTTFLLNNTNNNKHNNSHDNTNGTDNTSTVDANIIPNVLITSSINSTGIHRQKSTNLKSRKQSNDTSPPSTSRTPENSFNQQNSFGGLKFGYEPQPNLIAVQSTVNTPSPNIPQPLTPQPSSLIKDSPPSSPGSEASSRKRNRLSTDTKDFKIFQNGVHVTHMLGNQLNPASSVAQKMSDQLHMDIETHCLYTSSSLDSSTQLIGPPYPGKNQSQVNNIRHAIFSF